MKKFNVNINSNIDEKESTLGELKVGDAFVALINNKLSSSPWKVFGIVANSKLKIKKGEVPVIIMMKICHGPNEKFPKIKSFCSYKKVIKAEKVDVSFDFEFDPYKDI